MISTSDPALWRPDTFLFGHAEVGCGHGSGVFFNIFLKPFHGTFDSLCHAGRIFSQSTSKFTSVAVYAKIGNKQFTVGFGQCIERGALARESLL